MDNARYIYDDYESDVDDMEFPDECVKYNTLRNILYQISFQI